MFILNPWFFVLLTPSIVQKILLVCAKYHNSLFSTYNCVNHYINAQGKIAVILKFFGGNKGNFLIDVHPMYLNRNKFHFFTQDSRNFSPCQCIAKITQITEASDKFFMWFGESYLRSIICLRINTILLSDMFSQSQVFCILVLHC